MSDARFPTKPPPRPKAEEDRTLPPEVLDQINALAKGVEDMVQSIKRLTDQHKLKQKQKGEPNG